MSYTNHIGKRLREVREKMGWSQEKLAQFLDTTQPTVNKYENGTRNLKFQILHKISLLLKISLDNLVKDIDPFENDGLTDSEINESIK